MDKYRCIKEIGVGVHATVNLAVTLSCDHLVALKMIPLSTADPCCVRREIELPIRIRHANLMKLYEAFFTDAHIVLVTELCPNGDLVAYTKARAPLPLPVIQKLVRQIATGLAALHAGRVIHCDIKPANIFLDYNENIKIGDYGYCIARMRDERRRRPIRGNARYHAPELILDEPSDFKIDVWALGIVFCELLANAAHLPHFVVRGAIDIPEHTPAALHDLIAGMLEPEPEHRLSSAEVAAHPTLASL
ncbi:serine/threonine protein kinase [Saprolegnia parasitica CBS 223.65]|uniref:Serine/threonine protein kinase n=1 Tax=Saprolegnia parasitica (strain CBS 223.65) TaxID=695850 RepID=A0A067BVQ4_SAPPC|nr:serine/threonine protein kinase [Saprolegnia parasitica CBS 223.65]KDO22353.1 serine/threonine protein kinase [Saprolegnia parasitica CBS 223.65]|eukprot:XP_012206878.1 serine/threonine protein kinase [Saprolegnia parasitica CBS 223.65]